MRDKTSVEIKQRQSTEQHAPALNRGAELQKIRREILMLSDRAKKLADRVDVLITQQGQDLA